MLNDKRSSPTDLEANVIGASEIGSPVIALSDLQRRDSVDCSPVRASLKCIGVMPRIQSPRVIELRTQSMTVAAKAVRKTFGRSTLAGGDQPPALQTAEHDLDAVGLIKRRLPWRVSLPRDLRPKMQERIVLPFNDSLN